VIAIMSGSQRVATVRKVPIRSGWFVAYPVLLWGVLVTGLAGWSILVGVGDLVDVVEGTAGLAGTVGLVPAVVGPGGLGEVCHHQTEGAEVLVADDGVAVGADRDRRLRPVNVRGGVGCGGAGHVAAACDHQFSVVAVAAADDRQTVGADRDRRLRPVNVRVAR